MRQRRHFLWGFRPKCGLLIPNLLFINVFAITLYTVYVCLCNLLLIKGWLAGQGLLRKEMVDLASLIRKNDVAYKAYTRVLSHSCDTYWGRKLDICRPNGQKSRPTKRRICEWDDGKNATWWWEYVTLKISICEDLGQYVAC